MPERITAKWRPPLAWILAGVLGIVLCAPMAGLILIRMLAEDIALAKAGLLAMALAILISVLLGYLLWRRILLPVTTLAERATALKAGDKAALAPLERYGTRELQALGQSVLDMARTLDNREKSVRSYSDHVTHELKSPLTTIKGAAELLQSNPNLATKEHLLHAITDAATRMEVLLESMRTLASARDPLPRGTTTLDQVVPEFPELDVQVAGGAYVVPIAPETLGITLQHMFANAAENGARRITLSVAGADPQVLSIEDNGTGISPGNQSRIFEPFFTTRRAAGGTGMGLSIVHEMLEMQGASIAHVETETGTRFDISF